VDSWIYELSLDRGLQLVEAEDLSLHGVAGDATKVATTS